MSRLLQMVEYVEECVLRFGNACKFLNIVNNQYVNSLVEVDKVVSRVVTYRVCILHLKQMRRNIQYSFIGI